MSSAEEPQQFRQLAVPLPVGIPPLPGTKDESSTNRTDAARQLSRQTAIPLSFSDASASCAQEPVIDSRPWLRKLAAQLAVGVPECGWSVLEPLFMPLLLELEVPTALLAVSWLISPVTGIILQPLVGALSDKYGRKPLVLTFGFLASAGLVGLGLISSPFGRKFIPRHYAIPIAFVAFGFADLSHDLIVTPSRAMMNDVFEADEAEWRCAVAGGVGKLLAFTCALCLPRPEAFFSVALAVGIATFTMIPAKEIHPANEIQEESVDGDSPARSISGRANYPEGFTQMWIMQLVSWMCVHTWSFYFSSFWAQFLGAKPGTPEFDQAVHYATGLLLAGAVVFLAAGSLLPKLSGSGGCLSEFGSMRFSMLMMVVTLFCLAFGDGTQSIQVVVCAFLVVVPFPAAYQINANVPFSWLERQPGFNVERRGWLTGCLNADLAAAQAVVAIGTGPAVAFAGGHLGAAMGVVAAANAATLLATSALRAVRLCCPPKAPDARAVGLCAEDSRA